MSEEDDNSRQPKSVKKLREAMTIAMLLQPAMSGDRLENGPTTVWHYTDANGALGIIRTKQLWASDGLFMNDSSELQIVRQQFRAALNSEVVAKTLANSDEQELLVKVFDSSFESFQEDPGVFAICFCEQGDQLSQWRTYGRSGGGYALGFDTAALSRIDEAVVGAVDFFPVIYDRAEQYDAVASFIITAFGQLEPYLAECGQDSRAPAIEAAGHALGTVAQWFSARMKDPAFREEREWRLIYRRDTASKGPEVLSREYRASSAGLTPFVKLPLTPRRRQDPEWSFPLTQVRLGPTADVELAGRAMNYLLKDHGIAIRAVSSRIPLRG